jgi:hypothetical protein
MRKQARLRARRSSDWDADHAGGSRTGEVQHHVGAAWMLLPRGSGDVAAVVVGAVLPDERDLQPALITASMATMARAAGGRSVGRSVLLMFSPRVW